MASVDKASTPAFASTDAANTTNSHSFDVSVAGEGPSTQIATWRFVLLSVSLGIGLFLSFIDSSIVSTAIFTIGTEFNAATRVFWVASAYTLANVAFALPFTAVADVIGRFRAYLLASVVYLVFSIACGFAQTLKQLIAFRALQGLGGAGAAIGGILAIAGAVGPLLGGAITSGATWRWIFWFKTPVAAVALMLFLVSWPRQARHHVRRGTRTLDWVGCLLLIGASTLPTLAFQEAGRKPIWNEALFLAPLIIGICLWVVLVGWEIYIAKPERCSWKMVPIFPPNLMRTRRYTAAAINTLFTGFAYYIVVYAIPLRLQGVNGRTPVQAGIALVPLLGAAAVGSFSTGGLSFKKDMLGWTSIAGSALMAIGTGLLTTLEVQDTRAIPKSLYGFEVFAGLGFGLAVASASMLANFECELEHHAVAQGIVSQARVLGGSLGIAAASAILGRELRIQGSIAVRESKDASLSGAAGEEQSKSVQIAYSDAFSTTLMVACVVCCVAFFSALGTWDRHKLGLRERNAAQEQRESDRIEHLTAPTRIEPACPQLKSRWC
ncbi:major facilitator superfamily transporter like protein, partial [Zymoseptoria brevis]